ncbi:DUF262 domain-containing protein [Leeuwenhoekiella aequorea]|uniref:DUF262 domain-containing protein n=1 Tax=Leeuwenhoekiella aequorea TaxID=283736 RepID=A0A4Q0P641_9FLAO|nr:DUF262 domain-containing protein [Leeuwenhoekiella aequorea]RXG21921.1 putative protein DUF1524 [Leeuwenhoekiella aequorea]
MHKEIPSFSIQSLFENNDTYVIPIYQRNYTWGLGEITQLIQDISDYAFDEDKSRTSYYIGTLVVYERHLDGEIIYETIDGQQRLTTLNILLNAIHRIFYKAIEDKIKYKLNLSFDSRKKSTETLMVISNHQGDQVSFIANKDYNTNIKQRYFDAEKVLRRFLDSSDKIEKFYSYFTKNVRLVRVAVPENTDLNHYFEIMNNRGEQLEKHEVLKANMLERLKNEKNLLNAFDKVWEACSDMERYLQYGFTTSQRDSIFEKGDWNTLKIKSLQELAECLSANSNDMGNNCLPLQEIIGFKGIFEHNTDENDDAPERFNSVISFSNFLLHVLRIQTKTDIPLDDKRLIDVFNTYLKGDDIENQIQFVKDFGFNLLKAKHLFDQFVIKREFIRERDQWSLKKLKWYSGNKVSYVNSFDDELLNKDLIMLLAMFHVSTPTLVYKHWLNACLFYLFYNNDFTVQEYKTYLQNLAQAYLFDRYIAQGDPLDYFKMIYENKAISQNKLNSTYELRILDKGTDVENFVFNYLDYILWKENVNGSSSFEFTFRSSVEHYYPQNPISKEHKIDKSIYDLFGNLCLISSSKNSRLSNHLPSAKKGYYTKVGADSLKQQMMMDDLDDWGETEIRSHTLLMKSKLENFDYA